jgi:hypothetical protein
MWVKNNNKWLVFSIVSEGKPLEIPYLFPASKEKSGSMDPL